MAALELRLYFIIHHLQLVHMSLTRRAGFKCSSKLLTSYFVQEMPYQCNLISQSRLTPI